MHEARLVRDIVERIEKVAAAEEATRVERVTLEIGAKSHITPESFTGHFELLTAETIAAHARLEIAQSDNQQDEAAYDIRLVSVVVSD